jgi:hypothetical protein
MKKILIIFLIGIMLIGCKKVNNFKIKNEQTLIINEQVLHELEVFKSMKKFLEDTESFYPGAVSEDIRTELETKINSLLFSIINNVKSNPKKSYILNEFKNLLIHCNEYDTEDREQICVYLEKIMDILNIQSSDGLLNIFMYGFDPSN